MLTIVIRAGGRPAPRTPLVALARRAARNEKEGGTDPVPPPVEKIRSRA